jgi:ankyrin repeat protein
MESLGGIVAILAAVDVADDAIKKAKQTLVEHIVKALALESLDDDSPSASSSPLSDTWSGKVVALHRLTKEPHEACGFALQKVDGDAALALALICESLGVTEYSQIMDRLLEVALTSRDSQILIEGLSAARVCAVDININRRRPDGSTWLLSFCARGFSSGVQPLLDMNASVLDRMPDGRTALFLAVLGGHVAVVATLVRDGPAAVVSACTLSVNTADEDGDSPVRRWLSIPRPLGCPLAVCCLPLTRC